MSVDDDTPRQNEADVIHALTRLGLSAVPGLGGPFVELFGILFKQPLQKRREDWLFRLSERVKALEARGIGLGTLADDEAFVTAVLRASATAARTHQNDKLEALANAVANIAIGAGADETQQHMLLAFIDEFSEMHLRVLRFAQDPADGKTTGMGGLSMLLERRIPDLRNQRPLYDQIWRDLYIRGLVNREHMHMVMSPDGLMGAQTTELGNALLDLIRPITQAT